MSTIYPEEIHQFSNEKFMEQEKYISATSLIQYCQNGIHKKVLANINFRPQNTWLFRCKKLRLWMSVVSVVY
jgi:hypothetical protein